MYSLRKYIGRHFHRPAMQGNGNITAAIARDSQARRRAKSSSFHFNQRNTTVMSVFLLIVNQSEFRLLHSQK